MPGAEFVRGDIRGEVRASGFDIVYHLAAVSSSRMADKDLDAAWDVNVNGTLNLCRRLGRGQKLVFMSTAQVYGPSGAAHTEGEQAAPSNFYALTKLVGEDIVRYHSLKNGYSYVIFRLFNSYSADQPGGLLVGDLMEKFSSGSPTEIYNPESVLDMVHADDVIAVLCGAGSIPQGTYNLCSGRGATIREVYEMVAGHLGKKCGNLKVASDRKDTLLGDNSKLRSLGYSFRPLGL